MIVQSKVLKVPKRPIFKFKQTYIEILNKIKDVDDIKVFDEKTPEKIISKIILICV